MTPVLIERCWRLSKSSSCLGVRALMRKYARIPMDLADACLVRLAEETGSGRLLTLDSDFSVYRWRKTRPFELLIDLWE